MKEFKRETHLLSVAMKKISKNAWLEWTVTFLISEEDYKFKTEITPIDRDFLLINVSFRAETSKTYMAY